VGGQKFVKVPKVIAHRKDAESAKKKFLYKNLCGRCVSAVNQIKMIEFLNFSHFRSLKILVHLFVNGGCLELMKAYSKPVTQNI
jgi:hypothetical protein